jgi:methylphosphotriester-DNA--protein-cysteine methyltransferase
MDEREFKRRTKAVALPFGVRRPCRRCQSGGIAAALRMKEVDEILAMIVASIRTLRASNPKSKIQNLKSEAREKR